MMKCTVCGAVMGCNDTDRSVQALNGIVGKRLTYRIPN